MANCMKLSVKAMAFAIGLLWGACVLLMGVANMVWPTYGIAFLDFVSSIYPGYNAEPTVGSVLVGTGYAVLDGAIGGCLIAILYNLCLGRKQEG